MRQIYFFAAFSTVIQILQHIARAAGPNHRDFFNFRRICFSAPLVFLARNCCQPASKCAFVGYCVGAQYKHHTTTARKPPSNKNHSFGLLAVAAFSRKSVFCFTLFMAYSSLKATLWLCMTQTHKRPSVLTNNFSRKRLQSGSSSIEKTL